MQFYHQPQGCERHNQTPWVHYSCGHGDIDIKMDHIILGNLDQKT